ncbi:hypothetical protein F9K33_16335 [bacterium]|nr:MAG: hypothetical protein F9K33_16335 [bacterium]
MKYFFIVCFTFFIEQCNQDYYSALEKGDFAGNAFATLNYEVIANCTYPKWIEHSGGRSKFIDELKQEFHRFESTNSVISGFTFDNTVSEPIRNGSLRIYVLPLKLKTVTAGVIFNENYYLIAISEDGKNWSFVHTRRSNENESKVQDILTMFPALNGKIEWIFYTTR